MIDLMTNIKNISDNINEFYRYYFITFLIKNSVNEDKVMILINNTFKEVDSLCEIVEIKMCGKKRLAYYIKKQNMATYVTAIIKIKDNDLLKNILNEIHRRFKLTEEILRYLIYRYDFKDTNINDNLNTMKTYIDSRTMKS